MARRSLLCLLFVFTVASVSAASENDTAPCPSQVDALLASSLYQRCQRDVADVLEIRPAWAFTVPQTDAVHSSEACLTALMALCKMPIDVCTTSLQAADGTIVRVAVDKTELDEIAAPCRRRYLRLVTRFLADSTTTYDYTYLYIGIAVSVALSLVGCAISAWRRRRNPEKYQGDERGTCVLCFCIPIPLCC